MKKSKKKPDCRGFKQTKAGCLAIAILLLLAFSGSAASPVIDVSTFAQLQTAVSGTGSVTIRLLNSIDLSATLTIPGNKNVTIVSDQNVSLTRTGLPLSSRMVQVNSTGTLTLGDSASGKIILDGGGIATKLSGGAILNASGTVNLVNTSIQGMNNNALYASAVYANDGALITMYDGASIQNNYSKTFDTDTANSTGGHIYGAPGGVIVRPGGQFVMQGGQIVNNSGTTGGVEVGNYIFGSTKTAVFTQNGGEISGNRGLGSALAMGGGVYVATAGTYNMNGGTISDNTSYYGGGVAVHDNFVARADGTNYSYTATGTYEDYLKTSKAEFNLNGGTLQNNRAVLLGGRGGVGGGIYVSSSHANLISGKILDNWADNMGGGIYGSIYPYTVKLTNAVITKNIARSSALIISHPPGNGGGIWNCPIGTFMIYPSNGIYLFDNEAQNSGDDYFAQKRNADYLPNYYDGMGHPINQAIPVGAQFELLLPVLDPEGREIGWFFDEQGNRYDPNNPIPIPPQDRLSIYDIIAAKAESGYTDAKKQELIQNAQLLIMGNSALKGGGLGTNANTQIGEYDELKDIPVAKRWDGTIPPANWPEEVTVLLLLDGVPFRKLVVNKAGNYAGVFKDVPVAYENRRFTVTVKEVPIAGSVGIVTGTAENGFVITNTKEVVKIPLLAMKRYQNGKLADGQFTFQLKDATGKLLAEAKNSADGRVVFPERVFSNEVSRYKYTVTEKVGTLEGVTYDSTVYTLYVTTFRENGRLSAKVETEKNGTPYAGELVFDNIRVLPKTGDTAMKAVSLLAALTVLLAAAAKAANKRRKVS